VRVNLEWLRDWVAIESGAEGLAETLTTAGLEVDGLTPAAPRTVTVLLTGLQGQPRQQLEKIQIIPSLIDMEYVFEEFSECRTWLINTVRDEPQPGELPAHLANSNGKSSLSKSI
jgi:hypothetical protein